MTVWVCKSKANYSMINKHKQESEKSQSVQIREIHIGLFFHYQSIGFGRNLLLFPIAQPVSLLSVYILIVISHLKKLVLQG